MHWAEVLNAGRKHRRALWRHDREQYRVFMNQAYPPLETSNRCGLRTIMSADSAESVGRINQQIYLAIREGPSRMGMIRSSGRGCRTRGGRLASFRDVSARIREDGTGGPLPRLAFRIRCKLSM